MYKPFPVFSLQGDAYECGLQHGTQAADRVAKTIGYYLPAFARQAKQSVTTSFYFSAGTIVRLPNHMRRKRPSFSTN